MKFKLIFILLVPWLLHFSAHAQDFVWVKSIGGTYWEDEVNFTLDRQGNIFVLGDAYGFVDLDPGAGVFTSASEAAFIIKLDSLGNFIWAREILEPTLNNVVHGKTISIDTNNNIFITGFFMGTIDFDPGPATFNKTATGTSDLFILKLDSSGNFLWVKTIGGNGSPYDTRPYSATLDNIGSIYLTGHFEDVTDFNPDGSVFNLTANGNLDVFVLKLDNNGSFIWANSINANTVNDDIGHGICLNNEGNIYITGIRDNDVFYASFDIMGNLISSYVFLSPSSNDIGYSIYSDSVSNIYFTGKFTNTVDFDPGPGTFNLSANGGSDVFIIKLDSLGSFQWAKHFEGSNSVDGGINITGDDAGFIYLTGYFSDTVDFDPNIGIYNLISAGSPSCFIEKISPAGNMVWAKNFSSNGNSEGQHIFINQENDVFLSGYFFNTMDFDPGVSTFNLTSNGQGDIFIAKFSQSFCSSITLTVDSVINVSCIDSVGTAFANVSGGLLPVNYNWNTPLSNDSVGYYYNRGLYSVNATDGFGCVLNRAFIGDGIDTAFISIFDLNCNLVSQNFRSGFNTTIWLDAFNEGCVPTSGNLILILDSLVNYNSASPVPDYINGDTVIWNFTDLIYDSLHITPDIHINVPASVNTGDTLCFNVIISPLSGDADTTNNNKTYCFVVVNSFDPNDKTVYPQGECDQNYVLKNEPLTYTVRFQNTGNADAVNIYILDTLDLNLELSSVRILGYSHYVFTEVLPGNVLKFRFDNIMLPDSSSNEPESHGYVVFEINPIISAPNYSTIENTAFIYFDFNAPVVTNTTINTLVNIIPLCDVGIIETELNHVMIFPNPVNQELTILLNDEFENINIEITDITGKLIYQFNSNNSKSLLLNMTTYQNGPYFITVSSNDFKSTFKIVKQ